jgi:surface antigen
LVTALVVMAGMTFLNSRASDTSAAGQAPQAERVLLSAAGAPIPTIDTYPRKWADARQDSMFDTWGEYNRECTSYVAWMLSSVNGYDMTWHGNATDWGSRARSHGVTVDSTPEVGSVAWRASGHVAYVVKVQSGQVFVQDYNRHYDGQFGQRWEPLSAWTGFIHFKDLTQAPPPAPVKAAPQPAPIQVKPANPGSIGQAGSGTALQGGSGPGLQGSAPALQGSSTPVQGSGAPRSNTTTSSSPGSGSSAGGAVSPGTSSSSVAAPVAPPSTSSSTAPAPPAAPTPAPPRTYTEQSGSHGSPTFTNPTNASGQGPTVPAMSNVQVLCRVYAPQIASANPDGWWYRIASAPWNGAYYAVANTFWNGDTPGVTPYTHNTDWGVPTC